MLDKLRESLKKNPLLAVVGASGSGKSSVVLGGVIPSLKAGTIPDSENWHYYVSMVPGSNPLANLARLLRPKDVEISKWVDEQVEQLQQNPSHLAKLLDAGDGKKTSVLVIDQFEEIFTLCVNEAKRRAFIDNLLEVIESSEISPRIILTMRSDFESQVAKITTFAPLFDNARVRLTFLDAGELREAIEKPAELVGLKFEEGLVEQLIEDVLGEPAALPLLQFTLLKLWDGRERNRITWEVYKLLGGGRLALSNSADEFYNNLIPQDQVNCKRIFLKMVRPTEGLEVTSSRIPCYDLYQTDVDRENIEKVLNQLVDARLVKRTEGDTPEDTQVEVAHEALIRNWPRLVEWLEDERVNIRQRLRLKARVQEWEVKGKDKSALLRGQLLKEAQQYQDLNHLEIEFISASEKAERERRFLQVLGVSGIIGSLVVLPSVIIRNDITAQKQIAEAVKQETKLYQQQLNQMESEKNNLIEETEIILDASRSQKHKLEEELKQAVTQIKLAITQIDQAEIQKKEAKKAAENFRKQAEQVKQQTTVLEKKATQAQKDAASAKAAQQEAIKSLQEAQESIKQAQADKQQAEAAKKKAENEMKSAIAAKKEAEAAVQPLTDFKNAIISFGKGRYYNSLSMPF